jgi:antimicrobial peptide system SdpA family protein
MKTRFYYLAINCIVLLFAYNLFFSSIKFNAQTPTHRLSKVMKRTIPQGWGFFTKSPREDIIELYKVNNNHSIEKMELRNTSYKNFFGASRQNRKIAMEVSIISELVPDSLWSDNTDITKLNVPQNKTKVDGKNLKYLKSNEYVLVKRKIVPWAWMEIVKPNQIPYEIAHVITN